MKFVYTKFIMKGNNPDMGSIFHIKNQWNIHGHRKIQNSKFNASILLGYLTNTDASIRVYKFRPERTGFNMYAEYKQLQLTFLALSPWFTLFSQ